MVLLYLTDCQTYNIMSAKKPHMNNTKGTIIDASRKPETSAKPVVEAQQATPVSKTETPQGVKPADTFKNFLKRLNLTVNQILALLIGLSAIAATLWVGFYLIPHITDQTDEAVALKTKKEKEEKEAKDKKDLEDKLSSESSALKLNEKSEWLLDMKVKVGDAEATDIKIAMNKNWAPKTVENFLRLSYRGYYNGLNFHRMVEEKDFSVIQGGDPQGTGQGGESSFGTGVGVPDELWEIKPVVSSSETENQITNDPKFREPSLYADFDKTRGTVTYRKGLILMAKTQEPDSATSQFFITLDKTILPAEYTVFGVISTESMGVLDTISKDVDPETNPENPNQTKPSKTIKIEKVEVV